MFYGKKRSPKQEKQQNLFIALGTVLGFKGYMNNFEHAVHIILSSEDYNRKRIAYHLAEIYNLISKIDEEARTKMKNL